MATPTLYDQVTGPFIERAIRTFYERAFSDPIIGHFFFNHDIERITRLQTQFAVSMLGGPKEYSGRSLQEAHKGLLLKPAHFGRRQVLMREVLEEMELSNELKDAWLDLEEKLRPLILKSSYQVD